MARGGIVLGDVSRLLDSEEVWVVAGPAGVDAGPLLGPTGGVGGGSAGGATGEGAGDAAPGVMA